MEVADVEVRYGAFNALRTLSPDDAFLGQVRVLDDPKVDPDEEAANDSMAMALARATSRRTRKDDPFSLYLVDCDGPPMVHVARTRRCEVVVFGRGLKLLTPIVLGNGPYLLNASDGDQVVQISKIVPSTYGSNDAKVEANLDLGDVLRRAANMGATYPELVTILQAAQRQKNLPGPLVVDAVPGTSPEYLKAELLGVSKSKKDSDVKRTGGDDGSTKQAAARCSTGCSDANPEPTAPRPEAPGVWIFCPVGARSTSAARPTIGPPSSGPKKKNSGPRRARQIASSVRRARPLGFPGPPVRRVFRPAIPGLSSRKRVDLPVALPPPISPNSIRRSGRIDPLDSSAGTVSRGPS